MAACDAHGCGCGPPSLEVLERYIVVDLLLIVLIGRGQMPHSKGQQCITRGGALVIHAYVRYDLVSTITSPTDPQKTTRWIGDRS